MSQSFAVSAGTYTVAFSAVGRAGGLGPLNMKVQIDGVDASTTLVPSTTAWTTYTSNPVTLSGGTHTLSFVFINALGGDKSTDLDAVSVTSASPSNINLPNTVLALTADTQLVLPSGSQSTFGAVTVAGGATLSLQNAASLKVPSISTSGTAGAAIFNTGSAQLTGAGDIKVAAGTTLSLPALTVPVGVLNINDTGGNQGVVKFTGAVSLPVNGSYVTLLSGTTLVDNTFGGTGAIIDVGPGAELGGTGALSTTTLLESGSHVAPGDGAPGVLGTGDIFFVAGSSFDVQLFGATAGTGPDHYDQLVVGGGVNLDYLNTGGAILNVDLGAFVPPANSVYTLIDNDGNDLVAGQFRMPGGAILRNGDTFAVGSASFRIYYTGGDGNDVILVEATSPPPTVYVSNSDYAGAVVGQVVDGDLGISGTQAAVYGIDAVAALTGAGNALATVANSGTVVLNAGTGSYSESPNLTNGITLRLSGGNVTLDSLDSATGTTVDLQSNTLTTGDSTGADTIAGVLQGVGGSLVKAGSDTLTLTGTGTYTGTTTVSAGSLLVNGSLTSAVSIATGATLGGSGTVGDVSSLASNSWAPSIRASTPPTARSRSEASSSAPARSF